MKWWSVHDDEGTRIRAVQWCESRGVTHPEDVYLVEFLEESNVAVVHRYKRNADGQLFRRPGESGVAKARPKRVQLRKGEYGSIKSGGGYVQG